MNLSLRLSYRSVLLFSLALPLGCAGSNQGTTTMPGAPAMSIPNASIAMRSNPAAGSRPIKLAVTNGGDVFIFTTNGTRLAALRDVGAGAVASDINGNVYVVELKHSFARVREYTTDLKHTLATFEENGDLPTSVDTYGNGQVVAVTNLYAPSGQGDVSYSRRARKFAL